MPSVFAQLDGEPQGLRLVRREEINAPGMATPRRAIQGPIARTVQVEQQRNVLEGLASLQHRGDLLAPFVTLFRALVVEVVGLPCWGPRVACHDVEVEVECM